MNLALDNNVQSKFTLEHYQSIGSIDMCGAHIEVVSSKDSLNLSQLWSHSDEGSLGEVYKNEIASVDGSSENALNDFIAGRVAVRRCFGHFNYKEALKWHMPRASKQSPIILPPGWIGSISHKDRIAVAGLKENKRSTSNFGIDIEKKLSLNSYVSKEKFRERISTKHELEILPKIDGLTEDETARLRFSMKEAVYKSIYPILQRYVGFKEVEVYPKSNGTAQVNFRLQNGTIEHVGYKAEWILFQEQYFITAFLLQIS